MKHLSSTSVEWREISFSVAAVVRICYTSGIGKLFQRKKGDDDDKYFTQRKEEQAGILDSGVSGLELRGGCSAGKVLWVRSC